MKKLILVVILFLMRTFVPAISFIPQVNTCIYESSFTATNETKANIVDVEFFKSIIVSSASTGGSVTIYDSIKSTQNIIGIVDLSDKGVYDFELYVSSGLTYTTLGNTNGVIFKIRK